MTVTVESSVFGQGQEIPRRYTGQGQDVSPPLTWSGVPDGARELALICDDPDAPTPQPWVHWVIYRICCSDTGLPENVAKTARLAKPEGAFQGVNSWGRVGYGGPMPPPGHGVHHYRFRLYALDRPLEVEPGLDKQGLLQAISGHVVAEGELVGTYQR